MRASNLSAEGVIVRKCLTLTSASFLQQKMAMPRLLFSCGGLQNSQDVSLLVVVDLLSLKNELKIACKEFQ